MQQCLFLKNQAASLQEQILGIFSFILNLYANEEFFNRMVMFKDILYDFQSIICAILYHF